MSQKEMPTISLFGEDECAKWKENWEGMPEFQMEDQTSWNSVIVHFENREDMDKFSEIVGQKLTQKTQSIWFPEAEITRYANKRYTAQPTVEKNPNES